MRTWIVIATALFISTAVFTAWAGQSHSTGGHGGRNASVGSDTDGTEKFEHKTVVAGIRAEFEVMRLADMNIQDPDGNTHHIMVKLIHEERGQPIDNAVGRIKVIGPDKKEQINDLQNYSGLLAANFTFNAMGQYGVICVFKVDDQKHTVKFWYQHHS